MTKQEVGKLRSKFTRWLPSWIWAFQVRRPPQLLRVSITIVYTCQDHVLESLKMAFFIVILDPKYSRMTTKFVKQKTRWLHSSIKFANPALVFVLTGFDFNTAMSLFCLYLPVLIFDSIQCMPNKILCKKMLLKNWEIKAIPLGDH